MLSLGNCGLREFPTAIAGLTKLQWADLAHNQQMGASLAAAPPTLLTRLTRLATLQIRRSGFFQEVGAAVERVIPGLLRVTKAVLSACFVVVLLPALQHVLLATCEENSLE